MASMLGLHAPNWPAELRPDAQPGEGSDVVRACVPRAREVAPNAATRLSINQKRMRRFGLKDLGHPLLHWAIGSSGMLGFTELWLSRSLHHHEYHRRNAKRRMHLT
ncbi:MAG: hypothetical protein HOP03_04665 [Lysobacter sp.]|nr:hypothetical protein [Lysobacter sp.]